MHGQYIQSHVSIEDMGADLLLFNSLQQSDSDVNALQVDVKQLDDLMRSYTEASHIQSTIQTSLDSGTGLDVYTVKIANVAIEALSKRHGIDVSKHLFTSMESFDNRRTRLTATRLSLENFADHVIKVVDSLIETIKKIWNKVKEFVTDLFSSRTQIENNLRNALDKVKKIDDNAKPSSDRFTIANESHVISTPTMRRIPFGIKGKCDFHTTQIIIESTLTMVQSNREILAHVVKCLTSVAQDTKEADVIAEVDNLVEMIKAQFNKLKLHHKKIVGNKVEYTYGYLVAGKLCELHEYVGKSHEDIVRRVFNIDVKITPAQYNEVYTPLVLKKDEMAELGKMALTLIEHAKELDKVIPVISRVLEKTEMHFSSKLNGVNRAATLPAISVVRDLFKYTSSNLPKLSLDSNRVATSVTHYVRECAAMYKGFENA